MTFEHEVSMNATAKLFVSHGEALLVGHGLIPGVTYRLDLIRYAGATPEHFPDEHVTADAAGDCQASWSVDGPVAHYVGIIYYTNTLLVSDIAVG
jgi:hypothetical protein